MIIPQTIACSFRIICIILRANIYTAPLTVTPPSAKGPEGGGDILYSVYCLFPPRYYSADSKPSTYNIKILCR